jgi:hypothetical protein
MPATESASLLTGPQLQVLQALLSGHTVTSAATACGVGERTIRAWKSNPVFRERLREGQSELLEESRTLLCVAAAEAIKALVEVVQDPLETGAARVSAARALLGYLYNGRSCESLGTIESGAPPEVASASSAPGREESTCVPAKAIEELTPESPPRAAADESVSTSILADLNGWGLPPLVSGHPHNPPPDLEGPLFSPEAAAVREEWRSLSGSLQAAGSASSVTPRQLSPVGAGMEGMDAGRSFSLQANEPQRPGDAMRRQKPAKTGRIRSR